MGCGSSRDPPVSLDDETEEKPEPNEDEIENEGEEVETTEEDITPEQTIKHEILLTPVRQNGTSILEPLKPKHIEDLTQRPDSNSSSKRGETAVAFEVVDESLIRKHPPKKFQRLEDIQTGGVQLTPEELEMKQEIARKRRQNLLNKRVQSAKERSAKSAHIRSTTDENNEDDGSVIESPEDM